MAFWNKNKKKPLATANNKLVKPATSEPPIDKALQPENRLTDLIIVMDISWSMMKFIDDLVQGLNGLVAGCQTMPGKCNLSLVYFASEVTPEHTRVDINTIRKIQHVWPNGPTALYDGIGCTIDAISQQQIADGKEAFPAKTLFVIISDGEDNASTQFSLLQVSDKVLWAQDQLGWDFYFLGTNFSFTELTTQLHIPEAHVSAYVQDAQGLNSMFLSILRVIFNERTWDYNKPLAPQTDINWKQAIEQDAQQRGIVLKR